MHLQAKGLEIQHGARKASITELKPKPYMLLFLPLLLSERLKDEGWRMKVEVQYLRLKGTR
jgi:hypothetical protein